MAQPLYVVSSVTLIYHLLVILFVRSAKTIAYLIRTIQTKILHI